MSLQHNLTNEQILQLKQLQNDGSIAEAWALLASWGDTYADDAYNVVVRPDTNEGIVFGTLVENHWDNTAGPGAYEANFANVAKKHLGNYLDILSTGYWPSTSQIEQSYKSSVMFYGMPASTAFDGTFTSTIGELSGNYFDWYDVLEIEEERIDRDSEVFADLKTNVTVEIKTGKRRVIEYFLNPILRGFNEAIDER